jgi:hypothetical protein
MKNPKLKAKFVDIRIPKSEPTDDGPEVEIIRRELIYKNIILWDWK